MEVVLYGLLFVVSLATLVKGSDWFVDAAEKIGLSVGMSPFVIGVTIIAFGTSLPELAASIASTLQGKSEVVVSTVVGSNITNIALVLGLSAIVARNINMPYNVWHVDMPFLWGSAFLLYMVLLDQKVYIFEGILLLLGLAIFLAYSMSDAEGDETKEKTPTGWRTWVALVFHGVLVWVGARYTIIALQFLSETAGVPSEVIALSAVAFGTSLPEVLVSLSAARRGKGAMAVGNVLGSNVFNTFIVIGIPAMIGDLVIPDSMLEFYLPLMVFMSVLFGIMVNNKKMTMWEGSMLILFYFYFIWQMIIDAHFTRLGIS